MNDESVRRLEAQLDVHKQAFRAANALQILSPPAALATSQRRRTGVLPAQDRTLWLSLVQEDGVWRMRERDSVLASRPGVRARSMRRAASGELDGSPLIPLERLQKDQVRSALINLDQRLTPKQGLRQLDLVRRTLGEPGAQPDPAAKRTLLLIHGTFSESQSLLDGLARSPARAEPLFAQLHQHYDQAFAFDHPTLTVDPVVNARELALALAACHATVDIVAHSRGGLVARWWADALDTAGATPGRMVFVGSPLAGTGLAAAPNLRKALDLLANVSAALGAVGAGIPFMQAAVGLFQVFSSVLRIAAKAPIADVLVALVPGLRAQSLVGNNSELQSLRRNALAPGSECFFVRSNFEPEDIGWQFWKVFRKTGDRIKDLAADAIFDGDNDLVVDTASMTDWAGAGSRAIRRNVLDFGRSATVHHTNYFEQPETVALIERALLGP
jgi:hypothetical protein